jgi:predicted PurR-regulated permease PerM
MLGSPNNKLYRWLALGLPFPLLVLNGWLALEVFTYFKAFITVVTAAAILAFVLNFPVQFLQQRIRRVYAVLLVFLAALFLIGAFAILLLPLLLTQLNELTTLLPGWFDYASQQLQALNDWAMTRGLSMDLDKLVSRFEDSLPAEVEALPDQVFSLAVNTIDSASEVALTVVLAFYLLLDGEQISQGIFQWFPVFLRSPLQQSLQQNFRNYFRGQATLSVVMGGSLALAFLVLRVPFGLLFGAGVGLMALIPFGDTFSIILVSLLVASYNLQLGLKIFVVAFVIDQIIDQLIAPRLMGGFTGLHPVWIIVALIVGTQLGGLLGLLTAVPFASTIKTMADKLYVAQVVGNPAAQVKNSEPLV